MPPGLPGLRCNLRVGTKKNFFLEVCTVSVHFHSAHFNQNCVDESELCLMLPVRQLISPRLTLFLSPFPIFCGCLCLSCAEDMSWARRWLLRGLRVSRTEETLWPTWWPWSDPFSPSGHISPPSPRTETISFLRPLLYIPNPPPLAFGGVAPAPSLWGMFLFLFPSILVGYSFPFLL